MTAIMLLMLCACGNTVSEPGTPPATDANTEETETINEVEAENSTVNPPPAEFVLITGGTFEMGSPETESWRSEDETQHTVTVSDFYISQYELTQAEYTEVMGSNPSNFPARRFLWRIFPGWMRWPIAIREASWKG